MNCVFDSFVLHKWNNIALQSTSTINGRSQAHTSRRSLHSRVQSGPYRVQVHLSSDGVQKCSPN